MSQSRERTLTECFLAHGDAVRDSMRKVLPAIVTATHGRTVDVQLAIKNPLLRDDEVVFEDAPTICDVPWGTLAGGGFVVWVPPAVGNQCLLVFSDLSTDTWRDSDGSQPVAPGFIGKHTMDSPLAVPMFRPDAMAVQSAPANAVVIGQDGGSSQIAISGSDIFVGQSATQALALAPFIDAFIKAFLTAVPTAGDGGAAIQTSVKGAMGSAGWDVIAETSTVGASIGKGTP